MSHRADIARLAQIKRVQKASPISHDFTVFWVPRRTLVCEKVFEEAGVLGDVTSLEWPLWLQPLDSSLLSLGLDDCFAELYLVYPALPSEAGLARLTRTSRNKIPPLSTFQLGR